MTENWKPIAGFEGFYEVSDLGRVRSCARTVVRVGGNPFAVSGRIMLGTVTGHGYAAVSLRRPGQPQAKKYVHRLVASAFVEGSGEEVNHKDGDKLHNLPANLEWCSHVENMAHAWDNGLVRRGRRAA